jgi:hypothetical protein
MTPNSISPDLQCYRVNRGADLRSGFNQTVPLSLAFKEGGGGVHYYFCFSKGGKYVIFTIPLDPLMLTKGHEQVYCKGKSIT